MKRVSPHPTAPLQNIHQRLVPLAAAIGLLAAGTRLSSAHGADAQSPAAELGSFQLADPDLRIELVAAEPEVSSPVAIAWDAHGRLFVAEMRDYPAGPASGRIRRLEDRDADGRYETSVTFADNLAFPNGVMPWKDGVLGTAAPNLWFLRDRNNDGVVDERELWFNGFAEGNQQLRVNGLFLGVDGWIYGANGRSDGDMRRPGAAKSVSLRGHDFRFHPDTLEAETIAGRSQFGHTPDDWGNRFLSWNTIAARHEALPESLLRGFPTLEGLSTLQDLTPADETGRVFPLSPTPATFNRESTSHFNALAGLTLYRGDALPPRYRGNLFMGETLRNLVHRRVLAPEGASFIARRAEDGREFLASTDPWFHPVNFATGPDGALYVVDFYREWVEHPGFVPEHLRAGVAWQRGADHGRIWRITSKTHAAKTASPWPADLSPAELAARLEHANGWQRDTAQRLLIESHASGVSPVLRKLARESTSPEARVKALWLLNFLGALQGPDLAEASRQRHPRVREAAFAIAASSSSSLRLKQAPDIATETDARVRLQALSAVAHVDPQQLDPARLLMTDVPTDTWQRIAIRRAAAVDPARWLKALIGLPARSPDVPLARELAMDTGRRAAPADWEWLKSATAPADLQRQASQRLALLAGFLAGINAAPEEGRAAFDRWLSTPPNPAVREAWIRIALQVARDTSTPEADRLNAVGTAGALLLPADAAPFLALLTEAGSEAVAVGVAGGVDQTRFNELWPTLFTRWNRFSIPIRKRLLAGAVRHPRRAADLLHALDQGVVSPVEIDASTRNALLRHESPEVQTQARQRFQSQMAADRDLAYQNARPAAALKGDPARGAATFERLCTACHNLRGKGGAVGPDLTGIGNRGADALLLDILDPSRQVTPDFAAYNVRLKEGETLTGLIVRESPAGITLRRANLPDETIPRARVAEVRASGKSLMPDGLEAGLTNQDLADLLAHLGVR